MFVIAKTNKLFTLRESRRGQLDAGNLEKWSNKDSFGLLQLAHIFYARFGTRDGLKMYSTFHYARARKRSNIDLILKHLQKHSLVTQSTKFRFHKTGEGYGLSIERHNGPQPFPSWSQIVPN